MDNKLFSNRLLHVPLFQGFSRLDFLDIVAKIPFDFRTLRPNEYVVKQGEECLGLCVVLSGEVETECMSPDQVYTYGERLGAPWCLQIENLFGYHNRYTKSYRTLTETQVMFIAKQDVRRMLVDYPAFQINFYNALSTLAQTAVQHNWSKCPEELELRFLSFVENRSLRPIGSKFLRIRMRDLADELGATRLRVSRMLAQLSDLGLVVCSRGAIRIPQLEKLQMALRSSFKK